MKKDKIGKCHICGVESKLTFEHLPPQKANNNRAAHAIIGDELFKHIGGVKKPWDYNGVRYTNLQRGMGSYTLCSDCNNKTGNWYAKDYIKFSNTINYLLNNKIDPNITGAIRVQLDDMYPLRIFKQILCMFASTMHPEFFDAHPNLREFILNKEDCSFDFEKYRITMYAMKNQKNSWSGLVSMFNDNEIRVLAYMDLYPLGFILEIDPNSEKFKYTIDITNMIKDTKYDTKSILDITLNILERNTLYPADFRTKNEINKQIIISKKATIDIIKKEMNDLKIDEIYYKDLERQYTYYPSLNSYFDFFNQFLCFFTFIIINNNYM